MKLRVRAPVVLSLLLAPALALGEERPRFASFTIENDFFAGQDRHYTNGLQAAFVTPMASLPRGLRALPPFDRSVEPDVVLAVGQRIYTPDDTHRATPDPRDRPYAGWAYVLADVATRREGTLDHVTL